MKLVIFGCGTIANRIAKSCRLVEDLELVGFASKDVDKALKYCELYNCKSFGDYDYFLNSDVDAVYIATYNDSHYELIKKCLENKKHVICEKPMLSSSVKTKEMFELARKNNVLLMEALKSVFLPIIIKVKKMVDEKQVGDIKQIYTSFMRCGHHGEDHWINNLETGGALKDLGSYCVGTMNYIMGYPGVLINKQTDKTDTRADTTAYCDLDYKGIKGRLSVSNSKDGDTTLIVYGSKGFIRVDNFWKESKGYYEIDGIRYEINEELISDFYYELKHFKYLVENNIYESSIMSEKASLDILSVTE